MTADELADIVRDYTAAALAPVLEHTKVLELRILELETRPAVLGPQGKQGDAGLAGPGVAGLVISADGRLLAHLSDGRTLDAGPVPRAADGAPGPAGERGPQGESGRPGERGEKGADADPGVVLALKAEIDLLRASLHAEPVVGPQGPAGRDGTGFTSGLGPPTGDGRPGDTYLDAKTGDVYQCH